MQSFVPIKYPIVSFISHIYRYFFNILYTVINLRFLDFFAYLNWQELCKINLLKEKVFAQ